MKLNMIKQMERYARTNNSIISLGQGIPDGRSAHHIREYVSAVLASEETIDLYSDPAGLLSLRKKIANSLAEQAMHYNSSEIIVTAGAIEAINATLLTLVTAERDEVIIPTPSYSAYQRAVSVAKGKTVAVSLDGANNWKLSLQQIETALTPRTAAMIICNPNNPTGTMYPKETLLALCKLAQRHGFKLIVDEVYGNMIFDNEVLFTPATIDAYRKDIVRVVSFSKDFNLTGWRIGFLHSDRTITDQILPVHDTLINCAPLPSQFAALAALEIGEQTFATNLQAYAARREAMRLHLEKMQPWLSFDVPTGGYFFFPQLRQDIDTDSLCQRLAEEAGVVVIPGDDFGIGGEQHIRLCFGRSLAAINEGMNRLHNYLQTTYPR